MTTIIGVDFSGAWADNKSWVAQGRFEPPCTLRFDGVPQPLRRENIYQLLANTLPPAVVAMDFPFGVPAEFAFQLRDAPRPVTMRDVWETVADMHAEKILAACHQFVERHGEVARAGDHAYHPESYSPLHLINPVMLAMTYAGNYLLHRLHRDAPRKWCVPPLECAHDKDAVTLLETMPGALLKSLNAIAPPMEYNGYKQGANWRDRRTNIINNLSRASHVEFHIPDRVRKLCMTKSKDDCLDSLIAAVGAAMWVQNRGRFHHPNPNNAAELAAARLEGWIYVPDLPAPPQRPNQPNR